MNIQRISGSMFTNTWIILIIVVLFNGIQKEIKVFIRSFCPPLCLFYIVYNLHPYLLLKVPVAQWELSFEYQSTDRGFESHLSQNDPWKLIFVTLHRSSSQKPKGCVNSFPRAVRASCNFDS